jgi:NAD-dependent SIR2 family protein deacetylase
MVQAIVNIENHTNRVLNIIKAKYGLRDKSSAIDMMAEQYEKQLLEPELRPEYIEKLQKIKKQKGIRFKNIDELRKHIENS